MTEFTHGPRFDAATETPIGWVGVIAEEGSITGVEILDGRPRLRQPCSPVALQACEVLEEYFIRGNWVVNLSLAPTGTPFQQRVWQALQRIPSGQTVTYGALAEELGTGARAVGGACRANPIPLLIPCHRVLAANGHGGFAGHRTGRWPDIKRWLLDHEQ